MTPHPNLTNPNIHVRREILAIILLLALVSLLAWPGMNSLPILDDEDQHRYVRTFTSWRDCFGTDCYSYFRPIKNFIFYAIADQPHFTWHLLGLSLYLAVIPVIYLFLRRFLDSSLWAFIAVTLWATSPTQVSTVIWMSCANISIAMLFTCACLYFHDISQAGPDRYYRSTVLTYLCLFLAQTSYETAIAVPALCVLIDAIRRRPLFTRQAMIRYALLALVTLIYLGVRTYFNATYTLKNTSLGFMPNSPGWQVSISAPWFLWKHFSMWLMPAGRIEILGTYLWGTSAAAWELAVAWAWLLGMIGIIFYTWRRQPWIACGLLWFFVTSFPSSNFIPIETGPIADYYVVFPSLGLSIALVGCIKSLIAWYLREGSNPKSSHKLIVGLTLFIGTTWRLLCLPLFWLQADLWSRPIELYVHWDLTRTGQFRTQALIATELLKSGNLSEAKEFALKSHESAPWFGYSAFVLGRVALDKKDYPEAEKCLLRAVQNSQGVSSIRDASRYYLAYTYFSQEEKRHLVRETLLDLLNTPRSRFNRPAVLMHIECYIAQNKWEDALRAATKAVTLFPNDRKLAELLQKVKDKSQVSPP